MAASLQEEIKVLEWFLWILKCSWLLNNQEKFALNTIFLINASFLLFVSRIVRAFLIEEQKIVQKVIRAQAAAAKGKKNKK